MAGIKALRKLQLYQEAAVGVIAPATTIWRGTGTIEDTRNVVTVAEDVGTLIPPSRQYTSALGASLTMESIEATFEQLPYILEGGVKLIGTGVADGAGAGKIYDYTFPEATSNTIRTFSIEGGDNTQAEVMEYSYVESFEISGTGGEALKMSANWKGRQVALQAYTAGLTIPTVEEIIFSKGVLAIDTVAAAYGFTPQVGTCLDMSLKVNTGWQQVWTADGGNGNTFNTIKCTKPVITLDITFEHDAYAIAQKVLWRAGTPRKIQLKFLGTSLGGAGVYTYKTLIINLAGKWTKMSKLAEIDGNDVIQGTFVAGYDPTAADVGNVIVVNLLAALP